MNTDFLQSTYSDLRKQHDFLMESAFSPQYYKTIKEINNKYIDTLNELGIGDKFQSVSELEKDLKSIQNKCSKENDFAKKTVTITRPDLVENLMDAHQELGKKICDFVSDDFSSIEKFNDACNKIDKDIENTNELIDEVFSFKDDFNMHYLVSSYLKMISTIKKSGDFYDVIDICSECSELDEEELIAYNELSKEEKEEENKEEFGIIKRKLEKVKDISSSYLSITVKIYPKSFNMINSFVKSYCD